MRDAEPRVSVIIPVGPAMHHQRYLGQAIESVKAQTFAVNEILLIDDMASLGPSVMMKDSDVAEMLAPYQDCKIWYAPWRMGVAHAFNAGVSLARNELVFMLGSDDKLLPHCIERAIVTWRNAGKADHYYWAGVQYSDGRENQYLPCNAAMVTKGLWQKTGGFPPEAASGACDAAYISQLLGNNMSDLLECIDHDEPQYWYRVNPESDTANRASWQGVILATRDILTANWQRPVWGRYS